MIVTLTHAGGRVVSDRITPLLAEAMLEHREPKGRTQHTYTLPAIAWRRILDELTAVAWGPHGGALQDQPKSLYTAIQRIQLEVTKRERHPALSGLAVMGVDHEIIPIWYCLEGIHEMVSVYPITDGTFHLMYPTLTQVRGHFLTEWVPNADPVEAPWPLMPEDHWRFAS